MPSCQKNDKYRKSSQLGIDFLSSIGWSRFLFAFTMVLGLIVLKFTMKDYKEKNID